MKYKAVIFDMDGTIIATETAWQKASLHLLTKKCGLSEEESQKLLQEFKGASVYTTCSMIKNHFNRPESVEDIIKEKEELAFQHFENSIELIPGFDRFHKNISDKGIKTAIATNAHQRALDRVLEHVPLSTFFKEHIYSIDSVEKQPKPKPDIFLYAAEKIGINPKECIVIEDSTHGIAGAKAAGMFCIGINTGNDTNALQQADLIVHHYDDILIDKLL